jgi:hypothetical protein
LIFGEERGIFSDRRVVGAVDRKDETEEITGFAGSKERAEDTALIATNSGSPFNDLFNVYRRMVG